VGAELELESKGKISKAWLDKVFERVGVVLDESVKAGVECGSFGLQLMPNAFEVRRWPLLSTLACAVLHACIIRLSGLTDE
jgi:hypothetical protein